MKKLLLLISACTLILTAVACDDDSEPSINIVQLCSDSCEKDVECGFEDNLTEWTSACESTAPHMRADAAVAMVDCQMDSTCAELENDVCEPVMLEQCTTDTSYALEGYCRYYLTCEMETTPDQTMIDACVTEMGSEMDEYMGCYKESDLNGFTNCMNDGACDDPDLENECGETWLGWETEDASAVAN